MNRKDFDTLVKIVKAAEPAIISLGARSRLASIVADYVEQDGNSSFNREKFLKRCGVNEWRG